jgi:Meiotically up-regulated gene 113
MDDRAGHIYFLTDGTGLYKIGYTKWGRLEQRLKELNGKQAARPIEWLWHIDVSDRVAAEKDLHEAFAEQRQYGEWFIFSNDDLDTVRSAYDDVEQIYSVDSYSIPLQDEQLVEQVYQYEPMYSSSSQDGLFDIPIPLLAGIGLLFIGFAAISSGNYQPKFSPSVPRTISLFCSPQQNPIHIRSGASRDSQVVIDAPCGTKMEAVGVEESWTKVQWHQVSGFVASELIVTP